MKKALLLFALLFSIGNLLIAQTYLYLETVSISPTNPSSNDLITVTISGSLSSTASGVAAVTHTVNGNNIDVFFSAYSSGIGLTVLVPYTYSFDLGPLPAGTYTINAGGSFTGDYIPANQKTFVVSGASTDCLAYFYHYQDTAPFPPLSMDVFQFEDQSSFSGAASWYWDFGDGTISTDQHPQHGYFNMIPASYLVCLTILTADGCTDTYCDTVYVGGFNQCNAAFTFTQISTPALSLDMYQFTDWSAPAGAISWLWDFGDGATSSDQHPQHGYFNMVAATYQVCLTITTALGCTDTYCDSVVIGSSFCLTEFTAYTDSTMSCIDCLYFSDWSSSSTPIVSWSWDFGDGSGASGQNPFHQFPAAGSYYVCLSIITADSCTAYYCDTVVVGNQNPCNIQLAANISDVSVFGGNDGAIDLMVNSATAPLMYIWSNGAISEDLANLSAGFYAVEVIDALGCNASATYQVVQPPDTLLPCQADFSFYLDTTVNCINCYQFNDLTYTATDIISWFWNFGDGAFSVDQHPMHSYNANGVYEVCLSIITADSCYDVACESLVVGNAACLANFNYVITGSPIPEIIYADYTDLSIPVNGIASWSWDFGDGNVSSDQHPIHDYWLSNWGNNTVCLAIQTQSGCVDTLCENVFIGYDPCMIALDYVVSNASGIGALDAAIDLTVNGGAAPYTYYWNTGDLTEDLSGLAAGVYVVHVVDANACVTEAVIQVEEAAVVLQSQTINVPPGWSIFSSYINPTNPDIEIVLNPIGSQISIVKNWEGLVFWPQYGLNAIGDMILGQGYQIKVDAMLPLSLDVVGVAAVPELTPLNLNQGWGMLGYLRQTPADVSLVLSDIISPMLVPGDLELMKSGSGQIFWPYYNLNQMGNMIPGQGYQILMNNSAVLTYPANSSILASSKAMQLHPFKYYSKPIATDNNMTIAIPKNAWDRLPAHSSELAVVSERGELVGRAMYRGQDLAITIWGNDKLSDKIDGLNEGEVFSLVWTSVDGDSHKAIVTGWQKGDAVYVANKICVVASLKSIEIESVFEVFPAAPNPAVHYADVVFELPSSSYALVELYNVLGVKIKTISLKKYDKGSQTVRFSTAGIETGNYFYKVSTKFGNKTQILQIIRK